MRCPICGASISDDEAQFCPRCGTPLGGGEVTERLEVDVPGDATRSDAGSARAARSSTTSQTTELRLEDERTASLRGSMRTALAKKGWVSALEASALAFLVLLCLAGLLLLGLKLQFPDLGAGTDPVSALSSIVLLALGILGTPVRIGDLELSVVPMGALLIVGAGIIWATRVALAKADRDERSRAATVGLRIGTCFGLLCMLGAIVFRLHGRQPVSASIPLAFTYGFAWATAFAAVGAWLPPRPWRKNLAREPGSTPREIGVYAGLVALGVAGLTALFYLLLRIIGALLRGVPFKGFGLGDALAGLLYLLIFLPNLLVSLIALGLGAPIEVGARIIEGGRVVGDLRNYAIFEWGRGDAPWYVIALMIIPPVSCMIGGMIAQHRSKSHRDAIPIVTWAAGLFAVVLFALAALSEARLGAGLIRDRGVAMVSPQPFLVLVLGFFWALILGYVGWRVAEVRVADPATD